MAVRLLYSSLAIAGLLVRCNAQCPNTVAAENPNLRTMSTNNTWFIVPVPKEKVIQALNERFIFNSFFEKLTLLDLPSSLNFSEGMHPVLATNGYSADIRMSALQISGPLLISSTIIPFVSYKGGKTPLSAPLNGYIGGEDKDTLDKLRLAGIVPAAVSTLVGGTPLRLGDFLPANAAYQSNGADLFSANSKWTILPNFLSGPGVYAEAVDVAFVTAPKPRYSIEVLNGIIDQPLLLNGIMTGKCQQNSHFLNENTAQVQFRSGNVTLGPAASGAGITSGTLQNKYPDVHGFSACAQLVGYTARKCEDFEGAA
ncbi:hypothetical protein EKO04_010338 [Ascochyta lentis]|uniref:Uncharacterized protein n=1 Tax=Ascochyta lentis TaxID=205686 RepID=A0A8H7ME61_9PLEO|nr:hypothetical protein EKO04_010338 [Ascochyta lentis]